MRKIGITVVALCCYTALSAQKYDSIYFHLYTDSLKKGVYNYINVDGKLPGGRFFPLGSDEVQFSSSYGKWDGNSLIIDSSYNRDSVVVTALLKERPSMKRTVTIYMKKKLDDDLPLPDSRKKRN